MPVNAFNQPIGAPLPDFTAGDWPDIQRLTGNDVIIEKLDRRRHALFPVYSSVPEHWTYLSIEPFADEEAFDLYAQQLEQSKDPYYLSILDKHSGTPLGTFSLMRIDPGNRVIEVGWVIFSPRLQRTRAATEAQFLLMQYVFETLQYRRYEWKCDALNAPSRRAAERLGFTYEGTFRQAVVYKGRNRDTAWYAILDREWPANKKRLQAWLSPDNFDEQGRQIRPLRR